MITAEDFRVRATPRGFTVWQRVGSGWERLADLHPSREAAREFITAAVSAAGTVQR